MSDLITKDVVIIGAGAAGLMCAIEAGKRGKSVMVLDHNKEIGEKIRISGGGRCNFTNLHVDHTRYLSQNPHFCKSALARFTNSDFISLVERHGIRYHEKALGQLFCDGSSQQIINMLLRECRDANVTVVTDCRVSRVRKTGAFLVALSPGDVTAKSVVIASGGLSIPKLGASNFGYKVAEQFGLHIVKPKPGLVPLRFSTNDLSLFGELSGLSLPTIVMHNKTEFRESLLFTHRGLSGPAILQISSYWNEGDSLVLNLVPDLDLAAILRSEHSSKIFITTALEHHLPKRFLQKWFELRGGPRPMNHYSPTDIQQIIRELECWKIIPIGTEGYGKAEVTVGGIDTDDLSSKTMESKNVPGLFFIGEVVDVTGWLGGYNFQWAWSSGWVAGQFV
jgi:predicted Rossmann fold flavoprotein